MVLGQMCQQEEAARCA